MANQKKYIIYLAPLLAIFQLYAMEEGNQDNDTLFQPASIEQTDVVPQSPVNSTTKTHDTSEHNGKEEEYIDPRLIKGTKEQQAFFAKAKQAIEQGSFTNLHDETSKSKQMPMDLHKEYEEEIKTLFTQEHPRIIPTMIHFIISSQNLLYPTSHLAEHGALRKYEILLTIVRELLCHPTLYLINIKHCQVIDFPPDVQSLMMLFSIPGFQGLGVLKKLKNNNLLSLTTSLPTSSFLERSTIHDLNILRTILIYFHFYDNLGTVNWATWQKYKIVDGNETAPDGTTALMFAVGGGYTNLVKQLLQRGGNPWQTNRYGDNAFTVIAINLQRNKPIPEQQSIFEDILNLLQEYVETYTNSLTTIHDLLTSRRRIANPKSGFDRVAALPFETGLHILTKNTENQKQHKIFVTNHLTTFNPSETVHNRITRLLKPWIPAALFLALSGSKLSKIS